MENMCVNYNLEKVFYFTQNSLVKAALEKKRKFCQRLIYNLAIPEAYSEPCQICKTERFTKTVNGQKPISNLAKRFISDV